MSKLPQIERATFWRWLTNFWTLGFFIIIIWDFFTANGLLDKDIILPVACIYTGVLAIYSAEKEFKRWHNSHATRHPGEVYVIVWTILMVGIFIGKFYFMDSEHPYKIPVEVVSSYIAVLGILALTKESKFIYKSKKK
ncbi:MAG: hypothetical protein NTV72_02645 [Candidatus Taylorbacteria bacterium]|nr:hypothetical protein [Candidatus Taylorbacteria bacterium]